MENKIQERKELVQEVLMDNGFLVTPEGYELSDMSDIGLAKNKLHMHGFFIKISDKKVTVYQKNDLLAMEIQQIEDWCRDLGYGFKQEGNSWVITEGHKKMFIYVEIRGPKRILMAEYLNRHESLTDAILTWSILKQKIDCKNRKKKDRNILNLNILAGLIELEPLY